jgi:hypothetical protein
MDEVSPGPGLFVLDKDDERVDAVGIMLERPSPFPMVTIGKERVESTAPDTGMS